MNPSYHSFKLSKATTLSVYRLGYVYFSELSSCTKIRAHCGPTNVKVRILFPLLIERDGNNEDGNDASITIANERRDFVEGEPLVFDDSFYHSVQIGQGVKRRLALVIDLWHPEIKGEEVKSAITAAFPIVDDVSGDEDVVMAAVASVNMEAITTVITATAQPTNVDADAAVTNSIEANIIPTAESASTMLIANTEDQTNSNTNGSIVTGVDAVGEIYHPTDYWIDENSPLTNPYLVSDTTLQHEFTTFHAAMSRPRDPRSNDPNYDFICKLLLLSDCGVGKSSFLLRAVDNIFTNNFITTIGVDFKLITKYCINPLVYPTELIPMGSIASSEHNDGEAAVVESVEGAASAGEAAVAVPVDDPAANKKLEKEKYPLAPDSPVNRRIIKVKCQLWDTAGPERFRVVTSAYYRGSHGIFVMYDVTDRNTLEGARRWITEIQKYANPEVIIVLLGTKQDLQNGEEYTNGNTALRKRQVAFEEGLAFAREFNIPAFMEISSKENHHVSDALCTMMSLVLKQKLLNERENPPPPRQPPTPPRQANSNCTIS